VLIKAGSFIPTVKNLQSTDDYTAEELFIQYYPDVTKPYSTYTMFDDDKSNPKSLEENEYNLIYFDGFYANDEIEIDISNNGLSYSGMPEQRALIFELFRIMNNPESVLFDEVALFEYNSLADLLAHETGYFYSSNEDQLYVKVNYSNGSNTIRIENIQVTSIDQSKELLADINVFPNPGKDELFISSLNISDKASQLKVSNSNGKIVIEKQIHLNSIYQLNTAELSRGVYFIQIINKDVSSIVKWVKN
jgi:hypothetical protein